MMVSKQACDVTAGLEAYLALQKLPNMTETLTPEDAVAGTRVHILPAGSGSGLAQCIATGRIVDGSRWDCPVPNAKPKTLTVTPLRRLVEIEEVYAPGHVVPRVKRGGQNVALGDLQALSPARPFRVVLPLTMVAPFLQSRRTAPPQPVQQQRDAEPVALRIPPRADSTVAAQRHADGGDGSDGDCDSC